MQRDGQTDKSLTVKITETITVTVTGKPKLK